LVVFIVVFVDMSIQIMILARYIVESHGTSRDIYQYDCNYTSLHENRPRRLNNGILREILYEDDVKAMVELPQVFLNIPCWHRLGIGDCSAA
jgi:hypothetical protein